LNSPTGNPELPQKPQSSAQNHLLGTLDFPWSCPNSCKERRLSAKQPRRFQPAENKMSILSVPGASPEVGFESSVRGVSVVLFAPGLEQPRHVIATHSRCGVGGW
jgi:hypothetical protein